MIRQERVPRKKKLFLKEEQTGATIFTSGKHTVTVIFTQKNRCVVYLSILIEDVKLALILAYW